MPELTPFIATGLAALGLLLILLPGRGPQRGAGVLLALAGAAWLFMQAGALTEAQGIGARVKEAAFVVFSVISLAGGVQMISQKRPVYAALFFVLVILSTCGLLLLLEAWFMAFSVVIVYAGAILITYMFVLMLAQQASDADNVGEIPSYDLQARDPIAGVLVAFVMAGSVTTVALTSIDVLPPAADEQVQLHAEAQLLNNLPKRLDQAAQRAGLSTEGDVVASVQNGAVVVSDGSSTAVVADADLPGSTRQVGWDLVAKFPASLEVAGVVLLLAMFGAVVLARRQIDLGEDALRTSAGLAPLSPDEMDGGEA